MLLWIADCPEMPAKSTADVSSVKGSLFFIAQADLVGQIQKEKISHEELEDLLTPEQLELIDAKVQVALWYPIDAFNAFVRISSQVAGRASPEALEATGRLSAEQLAKSGLYPQLTEGAGENAGSVGRRLVTLGSAFYNFMRWKYIDGEAPGHFTVDVTEATDWSEELRHITAGFIEVACSRAMGRPVRVTSERPTPDRVIFRARPPD